MAERAELPAGLVVAGRYRIEGLLGKGGMGAVYTVTHVKTDEKLALKVLHTTEMADAMALERFQREARAPARIDSDHVVRVTDADVAPELDGAPFLVMELLKGRGLDREIAESGWLAPEVAIRHLRQLARGLDKAHKLGIVHRDLKPENIFLCDREEGTTQVKILDFGIAKLTTQDAVGSGAKTATGTLTGTPFFMAPEQLKGDNASVGPHTDVWAVGIIAHKMLTGVDFWTATTVTHLVGQVCYEPIPPASERGSKLGPLYDEWFAKCCARKIEDRFSTVGEAVEALATALALPTQLVTSSPQVSDSYPRAVVSARPISMSSSADGLARTEVAPRKRPSTAFLVGGVVAIGAVAFGAYLVMHKEKPAAATPIASVAPPAPSSATPEPTTPATSAALAPASVVTSVTSSVTAPSTAIKATPRPSSRPTSADAGHVPTDKELLDQMH